ncbi:S8 family peptidase [Mycetocola saprophilus]|uniref:S8 family peptidase n=1 Tax=Mycetocola saprophilus TaxID=76636 RepID=UPI003BF22A35
MNKKFRNFRSASFKGFVAASAFAALMLGNGMAAQASPPSAQDRALGLWYADALDLQTVHESGLTGKGVRIAVVDDGINLDAAELQGANIKVHGGYCLNQDSGKPFPSNTTDATISQHGTSVVAMLVGNGRAADGGQGTLGVVPDAQIDFYAAGPAVSEEQESAGWNKICPSKKDSSDGSFTGSAWKDATNAAVESGASLVSVSLAGSVITFQDALIQAASRGVTIVASALNPGDDSIGVGGFPAAGNGSISVNAVGRDNNVIGKSDGFGGGLQVGSGNIGISAPGVRILSIGSDWQPAIEHGTSYATPIVAGALALASQKYPKATQNQLINSLINTTNVSVQSGTPSWDRVFGYGIISLPTLLNNDPMNYSDDNPLYVKDPSDPRCKGPRETKQPTSMDNCQWGDTPTLAEISAAKPSSSGLPSAAPNHSGENKLPILSWILWIGVAGVLVIGLGIAVPILIVSRKRSKLSKQPRNADFTHPVLSHAEPVNRMFGAEARKSAQPSHTDDRGSIHEKGADK